MTDYAVLFPGQGSQNQNMLRNFDGDDIFDKSIITSSQILGYDIKRIIEDESKLNNTL